VEVRKSGGFALVKSDRIEVMLGANVSAGDKIANKRQADRPNYFPTGCQYFYKSITPAAGWKYHESGSFRIYGLKTADSGPRRPEYLCKPRRAKTPARAERRLAGRRKRPRAEARKQRRQSSLSGRAGRSYLNHFVDRRLTSLRGGSGKLNTGEGGGSRLIWPKMA
jgi:hypothetical protein